MASFSYRMKLSPLLRFKKPLHSVFTKRMWLDDEEFLKCLNAGELLQRVEINQNKSNELQIREILSSIKLNYDLSQKDPQMCPSWTFSSGSNNIDDCLDGGALGPKNAYFFYGKSNTGKTQIAHQLCVAACARFLQLDPKDSSSKDKLKGSPHTHKENTVIYIDNENTFRPARINQMAARYERKIPKAGSKFLDMISVF